MRLLQVGALPGECHLDAGRAPADELRQFPLANPEDGNGEEAVSRFRGGEGRR